MEDCLIVGIDIAEGKDISCMTVMRKKGEKMQVINQLFNKEAEDIYYRLININAKVDLPLIQEEAINRNMNKMQNIYSYKEILEAIKETIKLKQLTQNEREYVLNNVTPKKLREILAVFWLTHTNDEFFNYFGFNWVPPIEVQKEARRAIDMSSNEDINKLLNVPLSKEDFKSIITPKEILKDIEKQITLSNAIAPNKFMKGATYE